MKNKEKKQAAPAPGQPHALLEEITPKGKKAIAIGIATIALGFFVLSRADSMGRNWASTASPMLILGGYALVGLGIYLDP